MSFHNLLKLLSIMLSFLCRSWFGHFIKDLTFYRIFFSPDKQFLSQSKGFEFAGIFYVQIVQISRKYVFSLVAWNLNTASEGLFVTSILTNPLVLVLSHSLYLSVLCFQKYINFVQRHYVETLERLTKKKPAKQSTKAGLISPKEMDPCFVLYDLEK